MKNSSSKKSALNARLSPDARVSERLHNASGLPPKTVKTTMNERIVMPPAHVWDKIEKILDQQDDRRKEADKIITASFTNTKPYKRKSLYVAAVAGVSVVAGIVWIVR